MAEQTYVFIDVAYLERVHREAMRAFFGEDGELDIFPIGRQAEASRVYFYDSIDYAQSANESEPDWKARVERVEKSLERIRLLPGFFVRTGTVPGRDRGKRREQKEIDVMLAVDMAKHALKGNIKKAVVIAGDLDLRPAVEALVEEGVIVEIWYHSSSFAQGLPGAADRGVELQFRQLYSWNTEAFPRKHRIPREDNSQRKHAADRTRKERLARRLGLGRSTLQVVSERTGALSTLDRHGRMGVNLNQRR